MVTIKIKENSKQAKAFIEFAKTFPFVELIDTKDPNATLPSEVTLKPGTKKTGRKDLLKRLNSDEADCRLGHSPNAETIKAIEEIKAGKGVKFKSVKDLFDSIK